MNGINRIIISDSGGAVRWQFHYAQDHDNCFVSGEYEIWRISEDKVDEIERQIPGAWADGEHGNALGMDESKSDDHSFEE